MSNAYFSERELGPRPRIQETIERSAWGGVIALVKSMLAKGYFGIDFPEECPDGRGPIGNDAKVMALTIGGDIPEIEWPLDDYPLPSTLKILDLIEFCYRHVAKPIPESHHGYFEHYHLSFDRQEGQAELRERVNQLFARNGLVYELQKSGQVVRSGLPILEESLRNTMFRSGDEDLDRMLETAREKFLEPKPYYTSRVT